MTRGRVRDRERRARYLRHVKREMAAKERERKREEPSPGSFHARFNRDTRRRQCCLHSGWVRSMHRRKVTRRASRDYSTVTTPPEIEAFAPICRDQVIPIALRNSVLSIALHNFVERAYHMQRTTTQLDKTFGEEIFFRFFYIKGKINYYTIEKRRSLSHRSLVLAAHALSI